MSIDRRSFLVGAAALAAAACRTVPDGTALSAPAADAPADTTAPAGTAAPAAPTTTTTNSTSHDGSPAVFVPRGAGLRPEVALTFHTNGDTAIATALLDRLAARDVAVTAFVVGEWLVANPELGRRMVADGHELANHTWSHLSMGELDRPAIATEIDRCAETIAAVTGDRGRWFRPSAMEVPTGDVLVEAGAAGYATVVGYSVDPLDFTDPGADAIVAGAAVAAAGDIVSLHFGHADTVAAIDPIIDGLAAAGLRPVTVSELLRP